MKKIANNRAEFIVRKLKSYIDLQFDKRIKGFNPIDLGWDIEIDDVICDNLIEIEKRLDEISIYFKTQHVYDVYQTIIRNG